MRDNQRQKVYDWERQYQDKSFGWRPQLDGRALSRIDQEMTLKECQKLATAIARYYKRIPPKVTDGRGHRNATWYRCQNEIALPRWARQPVVVIHECAHMITDVLFRGARVASHGREFVGVEIFLFTRYLKMNKSDLARSANQAGVDFISQAAYKVQAKRHRGG